MQYKDAYPGIALAYYGNQGQLEYDFIVAPGADPNLIRLAFDGAEKVEVDTTTGDLVLTLSEPSANSELRTENSELAAGATLRLQKPVVYQMGDHGDKHLLAGTYVLLASETSPPRSASAVLQASETAHVAFQVAAYDASQPLIIDPVLSWATYLGGSDHDRGFGIAVDQAGNAYVTGQTTTPGSGFPGTAGSSSRARWAAAPTPLSQSSTQPARPSSIRPIWAAAARPRQRDRRGPGGQCLCDRGHHLAGLSRHCGQSIQSTLVGGQDAFVTKLNAAGTALVYSTYLGGSGATQAAGSPWTRRARPT